MAKASRSGISVNSGDLPVILGMLARGDRKHDVAAWFGLNQGRIAEVADGKHGSPPIANSSYLLPEGSPGPRARELRQRLKAIRRAIEDDKPGEAVKIIDNAIKDFDAPA